jgi:hypothetical protein
MENLIEGWILFFQNFQVTSDASAGDTGTRTDRPEVVSVATTAGQDTETKAVPSSSVKNIIIHPDQYNKDDFPIDYPDAKFFVIKSYSEDDVHKSIKYNVWSSTPNGNRRLDAAYSEAQGRSPRKCPIFLFFSVSVDVFVYSFFFIFLFLKFLSTSLTYQHFPLG